MKVGVELCSGSDGPTSSFHGVQVGFSQRDRYKFYLRIKEIMMLIAIGIAR